MKEEDKEEGINEEIRYENLKEEYIDGAGLDVQMETKS